MPCLVDIVYSRIPGDAKLAGTQISLVLVQHPPPLQASLVLSLVSFGNVDAIENTVTVTTIHTYINSYMTQSLPKISNG